MLAWLTTAGEGQGGDLLDWAQRASQIGFGAGVVLLCLVLYKRWLVPFAWVTELRAQMETMRKDYEARLAGKDILIAAKDVQIAAASKTLTEDVVPAVVRSQLTMERLEAELRVRRS